MASTESKVKRPAATEDEQTSSVKKAKKSIFDQEEFICTICQELIYQPTTVDCGHNFCFLCIQKCNGDRCPNCRYFLGRDLKTYRKNIFMEKMIESLGGEEYQTFCRKRELEKKVTEITEKFKSSKLSNVIKRQIDLELNDVNSIGFLDLKQKIEPIFGPKYDFAIISVLINEYLYLGDQIFSSNFPCLVDFLEEKSDLTNDQLIILIKRYYNIPSNKDISNNAFRKFKKLLEKYQLTDNTPHLIDIKMDEIINSNDKAELYSELEQMIDLYQADEDDQ